jgi:competence protein ComEA
VSKWPERYRVYILILCGLGTVIGLVLFVANRPRPAPIIISTPIPTVAPPLEPSPTPHPLRVYVTGAVVNPDVYILPQASIVKDAVQAAGGATADADLDRINLALQVHDQQQIYVPRQGEDAVPIPPPGGRSVPVVPSGSRVNINTASLDELETLPGIGPAIAQRIIDYRSQNGGFATIEEIMDVKGIGPATFAEIEDAITVE